MRSFDEWFDENCDGSDLAKDACRKLWDKFSDQINIICRKSYEKQQSKVDELQNNINLLTEALDVKEQLNQKLREREDELQKRVDAALKLIESWNEIAFDKTTHWTEGYEEGCYHCAAELEQALKGESNESST